MALCLSMSGEQLTVSLAGLILAVGIYFRYRLELPLMAPTTNVVSVCVRARACIAERSAHLICGGYLRQSAECNRTTSLSHRNHCSWWLFFFVLGA